MKIFKYNNKMPCPKDNEALLIYKKYKTFMNETLNVWKKDVVTQLMMYRGYADIDESRIKLAKSKEGFIPVISLKPVVGLDFDDTIHLYINFFKQYEETVKFIITEIFCIINHELTETGRACDIDKSHLKAVVNALKVLIASFNVGTYNPDIYQIVMTNFNSEEAAIAARSLKVDHVIGEAFVKEGSLLSCEADSDLIGSFYKYVRKIML